MGKTPDWVWKRYKPVKIETTNCSKYNTKLERLSQTYKKEELNNESGKTGC